MRKLISIFILVFCILNLDSCFFAVPYAVNQEASYSESVDYSAVNVSHASLDILSKMKGVTISRKVVTQDRSVIEGNIDSKKFKGSFSINVSRLTENSATISVKYNIFGDKIRSRQFLNSVLEDLKENYHS